MIKCIFCFLALFIVIQTHSQSKNLLDKKNGFKDYALGSNISSYADVKETKIGFRCGISNYSCCYGKVKTKSDWETWAPYIKSYRVEIENQTLFNEPVKGILLTVLNGKVIRVIVRVNDLNVDLLYDLFGKEDKYDCHTIESYQSWRWTGKNVELIVRDNVYDPLVKRDICIFTPVKGGYDLIFFSKEMAKYFDREIEGIKKEIKDDF